MKSQVLKFSFPFTFNGSYKSFSNFRCLFTASSLCGKNALMRRPIRVITKNKKRSPADYFSGGKFKTPLPKNTFVFNEDDYAPSTFLEKPTPPLIKYINAKEDNDRIVKTLSEIKTPSYSKVNDKVILEGFRLINDALRAGFKPEMILFSRKESLSKLHLNTGEEVPVYRMLYNTMKVWSSLKTCPGIMGIFKKPTDKQLDVMSEATLPITVICHNINDSGTLGAIIRSAAAVGCRAVISLKGCRDVWKLDVLRSGSGAHFRIPIISDVEWVHISNYISEKSSLFLIDSQNNTDLSPIDQETFIDYTEDWNDANTLCTETEEVLNVKKNCVDESSTDEEEETDDEENYSSYLTQTEDEKFHVNKTYENVHVLERYSTVKLPGCSYSDVVFPKDDIILFVKDANSPFDPKTLKLGCEFGGRQLTIPLENNIKRISPLFSLSVVLYEIRRQITEKYVTRLE